MLIVDADVYRLGPADLRVEGSRIMAIGRLSPRADETVIDARGGALLPGLHDHHLHLFAYAAAGASVSCGPPDVRDQAQLVAALHRFQQTSPRGWLRGVGYHESVAGDIDRAWLDRHVSHRPARIQHRSGRLWVVNSAGLTRIAQALTKLPRGQRPALSHDGRLFDLDAMLRLLPEARLPPVQHASRALARWGVTGFTDMTPSNHADTLDTFAKLQRAGDLLQHVCLAGSLALCDATLPTDSAPEGPGARLTIGPTKIHLHEAHLPEFEALCATIDASHRRKRPVAIHCVTEVELVYALAAWREAGVHQGASGSDRVEHASLTPPALLAQIHELGLTVVTQPNFVHERGDAYLSAIPPSEHPWLYRCGAFLRQRTPLAGGSDAPFGHPDPWRAMAAAVMRRTAGGRPLGPQERLSPEQALALFLGAPYDPACPRHLAEGQPADLCLLDRPWAQARVSLSGHLVRATLRAGRLIYDGVDQTPLQRPFRRDGLA